MKQACRTSRGQSLLKSPEHVGFRAFDLSTGEGSGTTPGPCTAPRAAQTAIQEPEAGQR